MSATDGHQERREENRSKPNETSHNAMHTLQVGKNHSAADCNCIKFYIKHIYFIIHSYEHNDIYRGRWNRRRRSSRYYYKTQLIHGIRYSYKIHNLFFLVFNNWKSPEKSRSTYYMKHSLGCVYVRYMYGWRYMYIYDVLIEYTPKKPV